MAMYIEAKAILILIVYVLIYTECFYKFLFFIIYNLSFKGH